MWLVKIPKETQVNMNHVSLLVSFENDSSTGCLRQEWKEMMEIVLIIKVETKTVE